MTSPVPNFNQPVVAISNSETNSPQLEGPIASCTLCESAIENRLRDDIIWSNAGDIFCGRDCYAAFNEETPAVEETHSAPIAIPVNRYRRNRDNPYDFFIDDPVHAKKLREVWKKEESWKRLGLKESEEKNGRADERAKQIAARENAVPYFPFSYFD